MCRLAERLGVDRDSEDDLFFMFLSSGMLIAAVCVIGQIDIMGLLFTLLTFLKLFDKDEKKALLYFTLAVSCKYFPFFFVFPALLLIEKNLLKLCVFAGVPLGFSLLQSLIFKITDPAGIAGQKDRLDGMVYTMLNRRVTIWAVEVPIFFILFLGVCIFAWLSNADNKRYERMLWLALLGGVSLFICMDISVYDYWFVYLVPFILLVLFSEGRPTTELLLVEIALDLGWIVGNLFTLHFTFSALSDMLGEMLLGEKQEYISIYDIYLKYGHMSYHGAWAVTWAIFTLGLAAIVIAKNPFMQHKEKVQSPAGERTANVWLYVRMAGGFLLCNTALILYAFGK